MLNTMLLVIVYFLILNYLLDAYSRSAYSLVGDSVPQDIKWLMPYIIVQRPQL